MATYDNLEIRVKNVKINLQFLIYKNECKAQKVYEMMDKSFEFQFSYIFCALVIV